MRCPLHLQNHYLRTGKHTEIAFIIYVCNIQYNTHLHKLNIFLSPSPLKLTMCNVCILFLLLLSLMQSNYEQRNEVSILEHCMPRTLIKQGWSK